MNQIERFWRYRKCMTIGTDRVSPKHLSRYTKEFEFRFNRRSDPTSMFPALISTFRPLP